MSDEYLLIRKIGQGSYGTVVKAKHLPTDTFVAIKRIPNVFDNIGDAKRLLREVQILRSIGHHKNIVKLLDVVEPTNSSSTFNIIYYVFELQSTDL